MFPSLLPKTAPFFELLLAQNALACKATHKLVALLEQPEGQDAAHKDISLLEDEADTIYATITRELSQTFITPIDREDILRISQCQEESIDAIRNLSTRLHIYEFQRVRFAALQLVRIMQHLMEIARIMLEGLAARKDCHKFREFRDLRGECDMLLSVGLAEVYDTQAVEDFTPQAMMDCIKWGQAYDRIELTVDKIAQLAEAIEEAVLKNA